MPKIKVDQINFNKASGSGIKVDTASPTFPWHDIIGRVEPKASGAGSPTRTAYIGGVYDYAFTANDQVDFSFHMLHDYAAGTDLFFHLHWSHSGTAVSGNLVVSYAATYAKGHNQANFITPATGNVISYATVDVATTPRYRHRIEEIQLTSLTPTAAQLDTAQLEVDGLILITCQVTSLPTVTGGNVFIHMGDIHYQSTGIGTKNKAPNFYT